MGNLDYIEAMGIGADPVDSETEATTNETNEESNEDLNSDSEVSTSENTESDTEQNSELMSLKQQIEGMEKRINDKDEYINELRELSKQKEEPSQEGDTSNDEDVDFWDNPEETISELKKQIQEQANASRIQSMQLQEAIYANTVEGYWDTVNEKTLQEAVVADEKFREEFNSSKQPFKIAYEYLKNKSKTVEDSYEAEVERRVQAKLKEAGVKEKKEIPPNINSGGKSGESKSKADSDGFAAVFGSTY